MSVQTCTRCQRPTLGVVMSMFNFDLLCDACKERERAHPKYAEAVEAEAQAVRDGVANYPGIGLPDDDLLIPAATDREGWQQWRDANIPGGECGRGPSCGRTTRPRGPRSRQRRARRVRATRPAVGPWAACQRPPHHPEPRPRRRVARGHHGAGPPGRGGADATP